MPEDKDTKKVLDTMLDDLIGQVKTTLPGAIADAVATRLQRGTELAERNAELEKEIDKLRGKMKEADRCMNELQGERTEVKAKIIEAEELIATYNKERENLRIKEKCIHLREEHAKEKVELMKGVVSCVFANNRFKYERNSTVPVVVPGIPGYDGQYGSQPPSYPMVQEANKTECVEGEGDVTP